MQSPARQTAEPHGNDPAAAAPERIRVALVGGSGPGATDDLYRLLRRRLLALSTFQVCAVGLAVVAGLLRGPNPELDYNRTYGELLVAMVPSLLIVSINLTASGLLWRKPPRSVFRLRLIEISVIGSMVLPLLVASVSSTAYDPLVWALSEAPQVSTAYVGRYANAGSLLWALLIMAYGAFIPNTWRRAALMTGIIAASPILLFLFFATWVRPLTPPIIFEVVYILTLSNAIAVAIVLFATSRIEVLRRQAAEARKLGQYVLKEKLGAGGMGEVYRAEHLLLRRPCALKTIRPEKAGDSDTLRRFEREVQITATLTHPNTVQVFDYGRTDDGTFYYVMEYLSGLTLEELVRRHGPLPPARAVHFLRQVCASLNEAHARGLTHRDVKPGNVMICERGGEYDVAKVLDFGLVRVPKEDEDGRSLTRDGAVAGTPEYMSPEQAGREHGIDPRSDLYSVGALAYFLLTAKPPFAKRSAVQMMAAHMYERPAELPAGVPTDLAAVVMRCIAKAPSERWPDAASLEAALAETSVAVWSVREARTWWQTMDKSVDASGAGSATVIYAESGAAADFRT